METEIVELTPSVKLYKVGETNYYLYKGEKNVLIDCGLSCTAEKLLEILEENIDAVLITHGHFDHVGGLSVILEQYDAEVAAHEGVAKLLGKEKVVKSWIKDDREFCKKAYEVEAEVSEFSKKIDVALKDGDDYHGLEIIETPGHSPDTISIYLRRENVLIASDALGYFTSSERIVPLFFYNYESYLESIKKIQMLRPYILGLGHVYFFRGKECDKAVENALNETLKLAERIKAGMSDEELIEYFIVDELKLYPDETIKASALLLKKRVLGSSS